MKAIIKMATTPKSTMAMLIDLIGKIGRAVGCGVGVLVAEMRGNKAGVVGDGEGIKIGVASIVGVGVATAGKGVGLRGGV